MAPDRRQREVASKMSEIRPFAAIRYGTRAGVDVSTRVSPPYDILDAEDKRRLLEQDARNFVEIDLPHVPPKRAGPPEVYAAAAKAFEGWLADGTLVRDPAPSLYVYHQRYRYEDVDYVRKMFFARLRLEPFGQGSVFPHEATFGGPKEDRLCLTQAVRANLSPIFGLYEDAENEVARRLEASLRAEPDAFASMDGVENRLWTVNEQAVIEDVVRLLVPKAMYIADGHHRYGTALLYREALTEREGTLAADHAANFVLCVLCAMEDQGLLILPTHRVVPGFNLTARQLKHDQPVEVAHLLVEQAAEVPAALRKFGPQALGLYNSRDNAFFMVRPWDADLMQRCEPERSEAYRGLAVAFLHSYLIEQLVRKEMGDARPLEIRYAKAAQEAVDLARAAGGSAFLMQSTTMEELRAVCQAGDLMPQKSTYFFPKLVSGLVINPLT